jgi:hypothetical protein
LPFSASSLLTNRIFVLLDDDDDDDEDEDEDEPEPPKGKAAAKKPGKSSLKKPAAKAPEPDDDDDDEDDGMFSPIFHIPLFLSLLLLLLWPRLALARDWACSETEKLYLLFYRRG